MNNASNNDLTIGAYEVAAARYVERSPGEAGPALIALLTELAQLVGDGGSVLELGSGPGSEALRLGSLGLRVRASDAATAFVEIMRSRGLPAARVDVRHDDLGGPYDAIFANAVFLHLSRVELAEVLERCLAAVRPGGHLVFTMKLGEGEGWTDAKLDRPRHFTYWRAPALEAALVAAGWEVVSLREVAGRLEDWLYVVSRRVG